MKYLLIGLLKAYRLVVSPLYGNVCRYYPSCSAYALRAVQVHGAAKGTWLTARRLLRCHPWTPGGYDPVPGTPEFEEEARLQAVGSVAAESVDRDSPAPCAPAQCPPGASPAAPDQGRRDLPVPHRQHHQRAIHRSEVSDQRADPAHVRGVNCST